MGIILGHKKRVQTYAGTPINYGRESVDSLPSGGKIYYSENDILLIDLVKIYGGFVIKLTIITFKNF